VIAEGAIVSHRPVPMHPRLVHCFGESTSGESSGFQIQESSNFQYGLGMVQRCWGYTYEQGGLRVRVEEERGGKETDGCPLTVLWYI
jgi:hypothetical protein